MSSSFVNVACLVAIAICARAIGIRFLQGGSKRRSLVTWYTCAVVAVCLAAQLRWPGLLLTFRRDGLAIHAGQKYRLVTSLFVQDGYFTGGIFNLIMLIVVGQAAELNLTRIAWAAIYLAGGVLTELVGLFWQPIGAGNSIGYMSLAGALLMLSTMRMGSTMQRSLTIVGWSLAVALCLVRDIHGASVLIGGALALLLPKHVRLSDPLSSIDRAEQESAR
jgi:rhomboid protease GluP